MLLILSITEPNTENRSTNILWRGLKLNPYFCFSGNEISGTLLPDILYPTKLSIHFSSKLAVGKLSDTPSVNN